MLAPSSVGITESQHKYKIIFKKVGMFKKSIKGFSQDKERERE